MKTKNIYRRYKGLEERDERTVQIKQCLGGNVRKYGRKKARMPMEGNKFSWQCENCIFLFFFRFVIPVVLLNSILNCKMCGLIRLNSPVVCWTVHHCDNWRIKNQLDATYYFIVLLIGSTCFRHYYAHHRELATMMLITTVVVSFLVCCRLEVRCG